MRKNKVKNQWHKSEQQLSSNVYPWPIQFVFSMSSSEKGK